MIDYKAIVDRFTSRKFLLAIGGVVAIMILQLTQEQIIAITALITTFIGAEGAKDFKTAATFDQTMGQ